MMPPAILYNENVLAQRNRTSSTTSSIMWPHSHSNVFRELSWPLQQQLQESMCLHLFDGMEFGHGSISADDLVEHFAEAAEAVTVGDEDEGVLPSNEFTTHLHGRTVGVDATALLKHLNGYPARVEDEELLSKERNRRDIPYIQSYVNVQML